MIRFLTHILDIKNLLGMQRVVPPTPYPANEIVLRTNGNTVTFTPVFTGSITVRYRYNGTNTEVTYGNVWSGQQMSSYSDYGTDFIIIGNVTQIEINSGDVEFVAINNTVGSIDDLDAQVRTLDLRNATGLSGMSMHAFGITELYALATTVNNSNLSAMIIYNSPDGGTLWIDQTQAYAATVVSMAEAHNWTIYDL